MPTLEAAGKASLTLADRMAQGPLSVREALRYALLLANALRRIHESGVVHGGLTPSCIHLSSQGIELMPVLDGGNVITPYTAPEVLRGRPADTRADIFAFGAIFFELMTGRPAFRGDTPAELAASIRNGPAVTTGNPHLDRVIGPCLARDAALRCSRAQRVLLELKLLVIALRGTQRKVSNGQGSAIHAELCQLEARLTARLDGIQQAMNEIRDRLRRLELVTRNGDH